MQSVQVPAHIRQEDIYVFDIYEDERIAEDLFKGYEEVLREAPSPFYTPLNGGHWVVTRRDHADEILRHPEIFSAREKEIPRVSSPAILIPLGLDPPEHFPYRNVLAPIFTAKAIRAREVNMREWAVRLIDSVAADGECEFLGSVASRFPVTIFMEMMGIPLDRFDKYRVLVEDFFTPRNSEERLQELAGAIIGEMTGLILERQDKRGDDLISMLVDARIKGQPLTLEEMQAMCFLLFLAGLDTVVNTLTLTWHALASDPGLQARLRENPERVPDFVEEALRLFSVANAPRLVVEDVERFGVELRAGEMVVCLNTLFGRDARENPEPLKIDLDRTNRKMMPFSTGVHLCLGHILARAEMRILTEEWVKRIPQMRVKPGFTPQYRGGLVIAMKGLDLVWP